MLLANFGKIAPPKWKIFPSACKKSTIVVAKLEDNSITQLFNVRVTRKISDNFDRKFRTQCRTLSLISPARSSVNVDAPLIPVPFNPN